MGARGRRAQTGERRVWSEEETQEPLELDPVRLLLVAGQQQVIAEEKKQGKDLSQDDCPTILYID